MKFVQCGRLVKEKTEVAQVWAAANVWLKYRSCLVQILGLGVSLGLGMGLVLRLSILEFSENHNNQTPERVSGSF